MDHELAVSLWHEASDLEDAGMLEAAVEKYELAVREGSVDAMINLGNIYDDKIDPPDAQAAIALYEKAVDHGSSVAAWNLAKHHDNAGDKETAANWMKVAAGLGDEDARAWIKEMIDIGL